MGKPLTVLAEKYVLVKEAPLEVEITSSGDHKSDHNVQMARTKALQAADVAAELYELLENMSEDAPLQAWKVTHVTQSADMLQDVLASLKGDLASGPEIEPLTPEEEND
jgi:hypothetical protein